MSRLAAQLKAEQQARVLADTPERRMARAIALGRIVVDLYAQRHGVSRVEAREALAQERQRTRLKATPE